MPRTYKPKGPSDYKITPQSGPKQETLDLGRQCLELLGQGVDRSLLAERLHVTRKRVDHALKAIRKHQAAEAGGSPAEPAPETPRRPHRAVHQRPSNGMPQNWAWTELAACKGQDLSLFFDPEGREPEPVKEARERRAKGFCGVCPVRTECLDYAIARPERFGHWGGLPEAERASERRRRMRIASGERGRRDLLETA